MHSLEDPTFERRVLPESPETIHTEGCALINSLVRELCIGAVMVTALGWYLREIEVTPPATSGLIE